MRISAIPVRVGLWMTPSRGLAAHRDRKAACRQFAIVQDEVVVGVVRIKRQRPVMARRRQVAGDDEVAGGEVVDAGRVDEIGRRHHDLPRRVRRRSTVPEHVQPAIADRQQPLLGAIHQTNRHAIECDPVGDEAEQDARKQTGENNHAASCRFSSCRIDGSATLRDVVEHGLRRIVETDRQHQPPRHAGREPVGVGISAADDDAVAAVRCGTTLSLCTE